MFPFPRSCELSFQASDDKGQAEPKSEQVDLFSFDGPSPNTGGGELGGSGRRRCRSTNQDGGAGELGDRRTVHRDVERQRRQEMAGLYSSLRSLLPPCYVQGKRSISDHICEAANYIKDQEKKVKEMERMREWLKGSENPTRARKSGSSSAEKYVVSVDRCSNGLEIKISCGSDDEGEEGFRLSKVLRVLFEEGLDVVSSASTKLRRQWVHVIHAEMGSMSSMDPGWLKRRLVNEICSYN